MGISGEQKDKKENNFNEAQNDESLSYSITKEVYIEGHPESLSKSEINDDKIKRQMEKSICKICIIDEEIKNGTGFLCLISYQNNSLRVLITCNHVFNNLKIGEEINLIFDDGKTIKLILDESRKMYTNKKNDITIIELNENEFELNDYLIIDNNNIEEYESIYIIHYEKGKDVKCSLDKIKDIDKHNNMHHCCATDPGSSGAPILNYKTYQVIGIHIGYAKKINSNIGKLMKYCIAEFINEIILKLKIKNMILIKKYIF